MHGRSGPREAINRNWTLETAADGQPQAPVIVLIKFEDRAAHAIPISLVSSKVYSLVWVWEMGPPRLHLLLLFS